MSEPFAALRAEYLRDLPAQIAEVAAAIHRGKEGSDARAAAALAHRICGTAGTLGLAAVSAAAGRIEDAIEGGEGTAALLGALADLQREAHAASGSGLNAAASASGDGSSNDASP